MTAMFYVRSLGEFDRDLFVEAGKASEAMKLWRAYYELEADEEPQVQVYEVPALRGSFAAIPWEEVNSTTEFFK